MCIDSQAISQSPSNINSPFHDLRISWQELLSSGRLIFVVDTIKSDSELRMSGKSLLKQWMGFVNGWSSPLVLPMYLAHSCIWWYKYFIFYWLRSFPSMMFLYIVRLRKNILVTFNNWWELCVKRSPTSIWRKCLFMHQSVFLLVCCALSWCWSRSGDAQNFHPLSLFYWRLIRDFSTVMALVTDWI